MKFEAQVELLQRFGRISGSQKRTVTSEEVARAQGVKANTAALNNGFFVEAGWLERGGRGQYVATDTLLAYTQRVQFDPANARTAAALLAEPMRKSWYWQALEGHMRGGGLPRTEALVILSSEAGAGQEYKLQLENVLLWLQFVELVNLDERSVLPGNTSEASTDASSATGSVVSVDEATGEQSMNRTNDRVPERKDVVLAFNVDLTITASDLAALSPEQIRALFEAVGVVAALKKES
jgi:hypothetical protein